MCVCVCVQEAPVQGVCVSEEINDCLFIYLFIYLFISEHINSELDFHLSVDGICFSGVCQGLSTFSVSSTITFLRFEP